MMLLTSPPFSNLPDTRSTFLLTESCTTLLTPHLVHRYCIFASVTGFLWCMIGAKNVRNKNKCGISSSSCGALRK